MADEQQRFEWEGLGMKIKAPGKRAAEVISVLLGGCVLWLGFVLMKHDAVADDSAKRLENIVTKSQKETVEAIRELGRDQRTLLRALLSEAREQTCLQRFEPEERRKQEDFCRRIGKQIGNGGAP